MKLDAVKKLVPPVGPLFSLTLIGLILLSAIIYYRAVKIQRFLEPALAISEPRMKFTRDLRDLLAREFSPKQMKGIRFRSGTIIVEQSLLFEGAHPEGERSEPVVLKKLSRVLRAALSDPEIRENISLILINARFPLGKDTLFNRQLRFEVQDRAVLILNSLFTIDPSLERDFSQYFAATSLPSGSPEQGGAVVEFRIIPTERLHIEVLQRLEQYAY
jgi:hypothetical protein